VNESFVNAGAVVEVVDVVVVVEVVDVVLVVDDVVVEVVDVVVVLVVEVVDVVDVVEVVDVVAVVLVVEVVDVVDVVAVVLVVDVVDVVDVVEVVLVVDVVDVVDVVVDVVEVVDVLVVTGTPCTVARSVLITRAAKPPVEIDSAPSPSTAPGAQRWPVNRARREMWTVSPRTKKRIWLTSGAAPPLAGPTWLELKNLASPATKTWAALPARRSRAPLATRRLQKAYSPPSRTSVPGLGMPRTSAAPYEPAGRRTIAPWPTVTGRLPHLGDFGKPQDVARSETIGPVNAPTADFEQLTPVTRPGSVNRRAHMEPGASRTAPLAPMPTTTSSPVAFSGP
jgi:hypothetical protein